MIWLNSGRVCSCRQSSSKSGAGEAAQAANADGRIGCDRQKGQRAEEPQRHEQTSPISVSGDEDSYGTTERACYVMLAIQFAPALDRLVVFRLQAQGCQIMCFAAAHFGPRGGVEIVVTDQMQRAVDDV